MTMAGMTAARAHDPAAESQPVTRSYDHPDAQQLVRALHAEQLQRYDNADPPEADPGEYEPPKGLFLVTYAQSQPVACGGCRFHEPDTVEVKKMYVRPEQRGRGHGRAMLTALEQWAAASGARRVILETGAHSPEAITLYTRAGYHRIPGYSAYGAGTHNRAFARPLDDTR